MRRNILLSLFLLIAISSSAQLKVSAGGHVGIGALPSTNSFLNVGSDNVSNASVGIYSSPKVLNTYNIGVEGVVTADSIRITDTNYGVLGIVTLMNNSHGRNYGVSGMLGLGYSQTLNGAGVYGANSAYYYSNPTNIQGLYAGYFDGPVSVSGVMTAPNFFTLSDTRLSDNLVSLSEKDNSGKVTMENILDMNVVEYNLKSRLGEMPTDIAPEKAEEVRKSYEYLKSQEDKMSSRRHYGVDAEELQKLYPDLVLEGQDGYLSVNYSELVPLLIRSIQVLKQELDDVKSKSNVRKRTSETGIDPSATSSGNVLYQNTPNPFKEQTVIRFKLAEDTKDASICIFDMTGKTLKKLPVLLGMESVSVNGYELGEGLFLYSLVVNGREIDTKKMVIQ